MIYESDRRFKLRRAASASNMMLGAGEVHTPTHKEYTLQKMSSAGDLNSNASYIHERYGPKVSRYHYYRDNEMVDDYWDDRRACYTPLWWPYLYFASRRYNLMGGPHSTYWYFPGLYYPHYLRSTHVDALDPFYGGLSVREPRDEKPWWSYPAAKRPGWSRTAFSDASRGTSLYKHGIIDFDTLQRNYMGPSYEQRRTEEMKRLYDPDLYPRYQRSY